MILWQKKTFTTLVNVFYHCGRMGTHNTRTITYVTSRTSSIIHQYPSVQGGTPTNLSQRQEVPTLKVSMRSYGQD